MLVPSTTTTATNYETWIKTIEVIVRHNFSTLFERLRDTSTQRVSGVDVVYYNDDLISPTTKTVREEEKLSELQLEILKAENK